MQAYTHSITQIINGAKQFIIPVFQRDYRWTEEECEQLWKDALGTVKAKDTRSHFMGSVVYVSTGDPSSALPRWLLIDGQQRVTTVMLLLIALRDHIAATKWTGSDDGPTVGKLDGYFLKNIEEKGDRQYKLLLRKHDLSTLCALVDGAEPTSPVSQRITDAYDLFREKLLEVNPEDVYRGLSCLAVVDITLDRGADDPQLIFESLNSTGMELSQSDLIRNLILMRLPEQIQTKLYETYWSKLDSLFRGSDDTFDAFVRDYLALLTAASKQERADRIYAAFRGEFSASGSEFSKLEPFLKKFLRFARYHAAFSVGADIPNPLIRDALANLRHLVDVPSTLMMRLYECYDSHKTLSAKDFVAAIRLVESYVLRRAICGMQTRGYWQVFANLAYAIDKQRPLESLEVGLATRTENYRFPHDDEFREALEIQDIYHKRVRVHLLDQLENYGSEEPSPTKKYTIEHVMPQNVRLSREWQKMLGANWRDVQREWLHRLGNLTLTGYNSKYSDRPFSEKKTISDGFNESAVRLNKFVREQNIWTAAIMEKRGKQLAARALKIWPPLVVDTKLVEAAKHAEMLSRARRRDVANVPMSATARLLFEQLRQKIMAFDTDIIELAEDRSISYHGPSFFAEILPRKNRVNLLLAIEFNEVDDPDGVARDASQRQFFVNAVYDGGVFVTVSESEDIDKAVPIIKQAWELAKA